MTPNLKHFALGACVFFGLFCGCKPKLFTMPSSSMAPTIPAGSALVADMGAFRSKNPARWDVVIFQPPTMPGNQFVMRIVALPGETVSFVTGGITVNGKVIVSPPSVKNVAYVSLDHPAFAGKTSAIPSPFAVPANCYFVLGDNSTKANDSRMWGALPRTNILGQAILR
jgi:signal peptidase I